MKKFKNLLAAFLVVIAAGMLVACSSNSDDNSFNAGTNTTPLFDVEEATLEADDIELSDGNWVFKFVSDEDRMQHSFTITNNIIYYTESDIVILVQDFSLSNDTITITSGTYKREEVFDDENKTKYINFINQEHATNPNETWRGNTRILVQNDYKYSSDLINILNHASETNKYTITTNKDKTRYIVISGSTKYKYKYYFAKK